MNDRRHVRRDEEADAHRSPAPGPERRENRETATLLDLQGSAGNRAVAQLLESRDKRDAAPALATLQRQPADQAPGAEPADSRSTATGSMTIPEMDVDMPILSFARRISGPGSAKTSAGDVEVAIALESLDPRIAEATAKGRHFATITVDIGSQTFTLHSVVITSFNVGGDIATLSLNFTSIDVE